MAWDLHSSQSTAGAYGAGAGVWGPPQRAAAPAATAVQQSGWNWGLVLTLQPLSSAHFPALAQLPWLPPLGAASVPLQSPRGDTLEGNVH